MLREVQYCFLYMESRIIFSQKHIGHSFILGIDQENFFGTILILLSLSLLTRIIMKMSAGGGFGLRSSKGIKTHFTGRVGDDVELLSALSFLLKLIFLILFSC